MKIERLIGILSVLLMQDKITAPELARRFEVSRRTINRDIESLCVAGIPIRTEQGHDGGISIMNGFTMDKTILTAPELQGILAGLKNMDSIMGTNRYTALMEKLNVDNAQMVNEEYFYMDLGSWRVDLLSPLMEGLQRALKEKRLVEFTYFAPGKETHRVVEPHLLVFKWYAWYLWGYCRLRGEFRLFKLARMGSLRVLSETFTRRPGGDRPDVLEEENQMEVTVLFAPEARWRLMEEFGDKAMELTDDGRLKLKFTWSEKVSLMSYLFGYRDQAEIVEPLSFREEFKDMLGKISRLYE